MAAKGSKLQVSKVHSQDSGEFNTTIDFTLLHCNNFDGNNNKFYIIEIQENEKGEYQLFSNYGRLGKTTVYETRKTFKGSTDHPITDLSLITDEYEAIISKKERGKIVKGNQEFYTKVDVISPTVGSSNIVNTSSAVINQELDIDSSGNLEVDRIIKQIKRDNIHNILSKTSLKLTSRGFETDVGVVTESHIDKAVDALTELRTAIVDDDSQQIILCNNKYFSLIPNDFNGNRLSYDDMVKDADTLAEHFDLMEDLRSALKVSVVSQDDNKSKIKIDLSLLSIDSDEAKRLIDKFETSKHSNHSHLNKWKIKNVFEFVDNHERAEAYASKLDKIGNEHELFHGSRNGNILSIILNGFMIPPASAGHCTGRMFGDGVYGASCSTKALNYSTGFWDGKGDDNNAFIFITKFAMGNVQKLKKFKYDGADVGYDSVHGLSDRNGGSLLNDEYIVYDTKQTIITHLIELEQ